MVGQGYRYIVKPLYSEGSAEQDWIALIFDTHNQLHEDIGGTHRLIPNHVLRGPGSLAKTVSNWFDTKRVPPREWRLSPPSYADKHQMAYYHGLISKLKTN